jgi:hypothetical protein
MVFSSRSKGEPHVATIKELLEAVLTLWSVPRIYKKWQLRVESSWQSRDWIFSGISRVRLVVSDSSSAFETVSGFGSGVGLVAFCCFWLRGGDYHGNCLVD